MWHSFAESKPSVGQRCEWRYRGSHRVGRYVEHWRDATYDVLVVKVKGRSQWLLSGAVDWRAV